MEAQKIACYNNAGFVMKFNIEYAEGDKVYNKGETKTFPIDQYDIIDIKNLGIPEGTVVRPEVKAILGKTRHGDSITYRSNKGVAHYDVKGTTCKFTVQLIT